LAISYQLSAISYQLSAISYQLALRAFGTAISYHSIKSKNFEPTNPYLQRPLGSDHRPATPFAGSASGRSVALPRSGAAVRAARFRGRLQADRARAALVPDPAAADDDHLHLHLRAGGAAAN